MTATSMNAANDIESQIEPDQSIDEISSPTQEASVRAKSNTSRLIDVFKRHKYTILLIAMILVSGLMVACLLMVMSRKEQSKESVAAKEQTKEFVDAELTYFTQQFGKFDPQELPQLLKDGKAEKQIVPIYDVNIIRPSDDNFKKKGFVFKSVQDNTTLMPIIEMIRDIGEEDGASFEIKKDGLNVELLHAIEDMLKQELALDHKAEHHITCTVDKTRSNEREMNRHDAPLSFVHIDFDPRYKDETLDKIVGPSDGRAHGEIIAAYNVWIPVVNELISDPLVVMDMSTIDEEDRLEYDHKFEDVFNVKLGSVRHNKGQKWYYKKGMKLGEVLIFRTFGTPHSCAKLLDGKKEIRRSVEVRCFAHTKQLPDEARER